VKNASRWIGAWFYLLFFGILVGGLAGILESLLEMTRGASIIGLADVSTIAFFYSLLLGFAGAKVGLVALLIFLLRRQAPSARIVKAVWAPLLVCSLLFVWVGGYVNAFFLPTMFAATSLLFDACWLLFCAGLWFLLFRVLGKRVSPEEPLFRLRSVFVPCFLGFLLVLAAFSLVTRTDAGDSPVGRGEAPGDRNILFVLLDALRPDHLGCYGYQRHTSPTIDRLASEGVLFERAYANAALTKESTATMMTSLFPSTHNVRRLGDGLPKSATTLMEAMQSAGYRTALLSANPMVSPLFGFGRGVDYFYSQRVPVQDQTVLVRTLYRIGTVVPGMQWINDLLGAGLRCVSSTSGEASFSGGSPEDINRALLAWIDSQASGPPFFAYLHYMVPHAPYDPPPPFDGLFEADDPGTRITVHPLYGNGLLPFVEGMKLEEEQRRALVLQYDRTIAYADARLRDLLSALKARGILDKTLVIVTADHGEEFYEHRGWGHGHSLFEELVRVPLIYWYPGVLPAGRRVETPVQHVDLMPTVLGAAGVPDKAIPGIEGMNLWPAIRDDLPVPARSWVFSEVFHGSHFARALIDGQFKIIYVRHDQNERSMVFDLSQDPDERNDLATSRPEVAEELLSRMNDLHRELVAKQKQTSVRQIDTQTMQRLKSLGYVQ